MSGDQKRSDDRSLHHEYERVRDASESRGEDDEQAKRDAAEAVHEERRAELPDKEQPPE